MTHRDYHIHSNFCDGQNTPEEIVLAAIQKGMTEIGILCHSYTDFDRSYCIKQERVKEFQDEIARLKEKYKEKIKLFCGVEQDLYSTASTEGFDYVIGSVHYIKAGNAYLPVDESPALFRQIAKEHFQGDYYALADAYYQAVALVAEQIKPDIIGHFDLITKFNEGQLLFSETDSRYTESCRYALDRLIPYHIPFEINTGAISRGYRTVPYPSPSIRKYIRENGGRFIFSSDCHGLNIGALEE